MLKFLYSVYDNKAKAYSNPFTSVNQSTAIRDFTQAARDPNSQLSKFSEDFTLVELAEFDDETAVFNTHPNPIVLGLASNFKE